jgi:hypothetical protein
MKKIIKILAIILFVILIDRIFLMPKRVQGVWEYESGSYFGDPIAFKQDFELKKGKIIFNYRKKISSRSKKPYLLGCYFGQMILYDFSELQLTRYSKR